MMLKWSPFHCSIFPLVARWGRLSAFAYYTHVLLLLYLPGTTCFFVRKPRLEISYYYVIAASSTYLVLAALRCTTLQYVLRVYIFFRAKSLY